MSGQHLALTALFLSFCKEEGKAKIQPERKTRLRRFTRGFWSAGWLAIIFVPFFIRGRRRRKRRKRKGGPPNHSVLRIHYKS